MARTKPRRSSHKPAVAGSQPLPDRPLKQRPKPSSPSVAAGSPRVKASRAERKRSKAAKRRAENDGVMDVIDLTDFVDDEAGSAGRHEEDQTNGDPGPSTMRARSRAAAPVATSAKAAVEDVYTPTSFKPIKRSMASGRARLSVTPPVTPAASSVSVAEPIAPGRQTADVLIDEVSIQSAASGGDDAPPAHFQPPGLFSTTMIPASADLAGHTTTESKGSGEQKPLALLLPEHVQIDDVLSDGAADSANESFREEGSSMEGLHFFDSDVARGVTRYFDPDADEEPVGAEATFLATADQSKICTNCKKPGHKPRDCPHIICTTCGEMDSHERRDCPFGVTCFSCGLRGHRAQECPTPSSKASRRNGCERCGNREHKENACPSLWRIYVYHSAANRQSILTAKRAETGWAKEAVGGDSEDWCYNCARTGHLGDDCPMRRGSLARLSTASAFSLQIASAGPFARIPSSQSQLGLRDRIADTPSHRRFDEGDFEDIEDESHLPGVKKPFEGLQAGRKTREKAQKRARDMDAAVGQSDDDVDDYTGDAAFRGGAGSRGRGLAIRGRGGRGGGNQRSTPVQRAAQRAWDSELRSRGERSGGMPFGHSHLMSPSAMPASAPAKPQGIVFGNIAGLPTKPPGASSYPDTPTASGSGSRSGGSGAGRGGSAAARADNWKNRASKALIERALGHSSAPTSRDRSPVSAPSPLSQQGDSSSPRKRRRRQEDATDGPDFEMQWRQGGNGGGSVRDWGREEDRRERQERKEGKEARGDGGSRYGVKGGISVRGASGAAARGGGAGGGRGGGRGGSPRGGRQGPATPVGQRYRGGY